MSRIAAAAALVLLLPCAALFMSHAGAQTALQDIVLRPGRTAALAGAWTTVADATAADGIAVRHPDAGAPKLAHALAAPANHFEVTFTAEANRPYRLWIRSRADGDHWSNDSVFVQFSRSVDETGAAAYRIGTTSSLTVNLEDCLGCGISGWGWQDTGWRRGVLGPEVLFEVSGTQKMRVQTREDGLRIDQIVLSPARYLTSSPGALKNDTTLVAVTGATPTVTVVRGQYLQQMSSSRVIVVWATRESGTPRVRVTRGSSMATATGTSRRVPASVNGLGYDYYHHEVTLTSLAPSTLYNYDAYVGEALVSSSSFRTAPQTGSGTVSFIAFGDSGTGSTVQRQLASRMAADTFDLALHTGDIAYGNSGGTGDPTYRTYHDWFFDVYSGWLRSRPFFPSEGNHDSRPSNGNGAIYRDIFSLPRNGASPSYPEHAERFYSFDYGPVHFVALDTEFAFQNTTRRTEQLSWLESDLASTTQPWKVAFFHRSPYTAGGEHGSDLAVRAAFAPVFERYGVALVLSSHEHVYERSRPLASSSADAPGTYVVTGGGGAPVYPAGKGDWTAFAASRHHYVRGAVSGCRMSIEAIGADGSVFDWAVIDRCQAGGSAPEVVLYAADAPVRQGGWIVQSDSTAAGGRMIRHPNAGAAKLAGPLAQPPHYFELTFNAHAGVPYRLWMRGRADGNYWGNDSVFIQFDNSVNAAGSAQFRIGTTSSTVYNLEECKDCGLSGWGWEDNGWGRNVLGPLVYFRTTGPQRLRVQTREDGLSIDQIVLSPKRFLTSSPGAVKNDATILPRSQ